MDLNSIIEIAGNSIYGLQALSAIFGAAYVVLVLRRISQKRFANSASGQAFLEEAVSLAKAKRFEELSRLCDSPPYWSKAVPQLILVALANQDRSPAKLKQLLAERFEREVLSDLDNGVAWINTVIKSAPMLGLLGTVVGMIAAFGKIASMQKSGTDPSILANDISLALITTAVGLIIAIPLMIAISAIQVRIGKMQDAVQDLLGQFLEQFEAVQSRSTGSQRAG